MMPRITITPKYSPEEHAVLVEARNAEIGEDDREGEEHVESGKREALADADLALLAVENAEIERQQRGHDRNEGEPRPDRRAQPEHRQKIHWSVPVERRDSDIAAGQPPEGPGFGAC
jgi:hypothetical protein